MIWTWVTDSISYSDNSYAKVSPHGVVANTLDWDIIVSEFEPQSRYYVQFQINTLETGMNSFISIHVKV